MPMPTIINPLNTEEWKREREEAERKEPSFQSAKWTKTTVDEGEEVGLEATVRDIADGNTVTLQVFPEGKGPEDGAAYAKLPVMVIDGAASAKWSYRADRREMPPEQNPRFTFTAHSAWCNFAKSSNALEVKLKRPEITKAEWRDKDGNSTGKGLVGEPLKLHAEARDFEDGQGVTLTVRNAATGEEVFQTGAEVRDGIAEAEWTYHYEHDPMNPLKEKPKFYFTADGLRCKRAKSGECEMSQTVRISVQDIYGDSYGELSVKLLQYGNEKEMECKTDSEGKLEKSDLIPGKYSLVFVREDKGE